MTVNEDCPVADDIGYSHRIIIKMTCKSRDKPPLRPTDAWNDNLILRTAAMQQHARGTVIKSPGSA